MPTQDLCRRAAAALRIAGPDSALTSHTAAYLYGCRAADDTPVHVAVPYRRRRRSRPGMTVHHNPLNPRHVETLYGLRLLALEHSLAEMLCRAHAPTAFACLREAINMQPDDSDFLERVTQAVRIRADMRGRRRAMILLKLATGL